MVQQWLTGLLGLWLVLLAFLGFSGDALTWSLMITGFLVTALGFWGLETSGRTADSGRGSYSDSVFQ